MPELEALERIIEAGGPHIEATTLGSVPSKTGGKPLPLIAITLGNPAPECPGIGFFGGVHGLERIGSEVVLFFLHNLVTRLKWDASLQRQLETLRLVFMPVVNPGGMLLGTRANPNGVDLMRNSPVDALGPVPFLIGGQRISAGLPWFRGLPQHGLEPENVAVFRVVESHLLPRPFSMVLDCHSGFGLTDRIWFPFAHTRQPIAHLAEMRALKRLFEQTHAHHPYVFEPQSLQYLAHGDLWDHVYQCASKHVGHTFLPLTLEMGSWLWIKKNPRQLFSLHGIFNPLIEHRQHRVLRRHLSLLDFLARATGSHVNWMPDAHARAELHADALRDWY